MRSGVAALAVLLAAGMAAGTAKAAPRLDGVQASGTLRVCVWPDYYAISYRNPRTGELQGIDIDLANAFASDLGVAVAFVETSFVRFVDDLLADRCDIGMFAIGVTPARAQRVAFSDPYLRSGIYAVTTRAHARIHGWEDIDRDGVVVAVQKDTYMDGFARTSFKAAKVVAVTRPQEREDEVQSGRADAFLTDFPYGQRMLAFHAWARLIQPESPVQVTPYAYAVSPGDGAWLDRVNAFVAAVKQDGRLAAFAARNGLTPIIATD
ncbi:substrate-binding periplasmic protein [Azospirillum sp. sgz301742]